MALNTRIGPTAAAAALGLAALAGAGSAKAVTCDAVIASLPAELQAHVIYGSGGSAITPTLSKVAYTLSKSSTPIFVFYQDKGGAGQGYADFVNSKGGTNDRPFRYWITAADVTNNDKTCNVSSTDLTAGRAVDFATTGGTLALFAGATLAADTAVFTGPIQGVNVVVPWASTETAISTEALYYVYGFGAPDNVAGASNPIPWTNKSYIFKRAKTAFVQQLVRSAILTLGGNATNFPEDFPGATFTGPKDDNQTTVDNVIKAAADGFTQQAIGFTSGPTADKNRGAGKVHTLAYQHTGQDAAYWPDSTSDGFDKLNIRNGHYFLWDTNQFFTKVTGPNTSATLDQIVNLDVKAFIGYFTGQLASPTVPADVAGHDAVLEAIVKTGSIPQCAMQVKRASDLSGLACYAPPAPCGHYFESIATGSAAGDTCDSDNDCNKAEPKCRFKFCEAY